MTLLILADDLTGAADSAARCYHAGLPAHIYVQPPQPPLPTGAVALSSDSRHLPPDEAAERVQGMIAQVVVQVENLDSKPQNNPLSRLGRVRVGLAVPYPVQPSLTWYKKIDSTLRGNIGAELDAMLTALSQPEKPACAIICPSFPAQGRGLADGYLVYDQLSPRTLHLPTMLTQQTQRKIATFTISDVRISVDHLADRLRAAHQAQAQLLVVDALTDADLDTLLAAAKAALPAALFCGSAGLIEKVARDLALGLYRTELVEVSPLASLKRPMLAIVGSGSTMSHRQLAALRALSVVNVFAAMSEHEEFIKISSSRSSPGHIGWAWHLPQPGPGDVLEGPTARGLAANLARLGAGLVRSLQPQTLILVGGDTTVHVLAQLGINQLTVVAELMPGIPLLTGVDAMGKTHTIVTKAGNFGDEQTLVRLFGQSVTVG